MIPPDDDLACVTHPFVGLRAFRYPDRRFFFGREQQLEVLVPLSLGSRFVTVVGSSGSGKSSLVRAGLLPRLESAEPEHGFTWTEFRPRESPIRELAQAICSISGAKDDLSEALTDRLELLLRQSSFGVRDAISQIRFERSRKLFILIDQFEEIFRFAGLRSKANAYAESTAESRDEAMAFVRLLLTAAQISEYQIHIAITMRSDFIGDCARFHGLPEAVTQSQFLVPSLTRDQRARVICKPIELAGATIDPALVQTVLNDTNEEPNQLPVLQHAMMRCWEVASRRTRGSSQKPEITLNDYKIVGGVREALSLHANEIVKQIKDIEIGTQPDAVEIAIKRVFQALTEVDESGRTVRRPQKFSQVVQAIATNDTPEAGLEAEKICRLIVSQFAKPQSSFLRAPVGEELNGNSIVDIGHEALIRCWDKLRGLGDTDWVREEQEDREKYRILVRVAAVNGIIKAEALPAFESWWSTRKPTRGWARRYAVGNVDHFDAAMDVLRRSRSEIEEAQKARAQLARAYRVVFFNVLWSVGAASIAIFALAQLLRGNAEQEFATFNFNRFRFVQAIHDAGAVYDSLARPLVIYFERLRDVDRADTLLAKETTKREVTNERKSFDAAQERLIHAEAEQQRWLDQLNQYNEHLWKALFESEREKIFASATRILTSAPDPESRLRLAMYAVAAIPEGREDLNGILRKAVSDSPQGNLKLPGATQTWGVAYDLRDNHRAAVGDEDGVAWLWDPVTYLSVPDPNIKLWARSAAGGLINGLAFNEDGSLLAAAYRSSGVVVWGLSGEPKVVCKLRSMGEGIGAYGVAFHGSLLAIAGGDHAVHIWDVSKKQCPDTEKSFSRGDMVLGVAISGDGKMLAAASADGSVVVWNIDNPEIKILEERFGRPMFAVAFSRDAKLLAATGADGLSYFWEIRDSSDGIEIKRRNTDDLSSAGELSSNVQGSKRGTLGQISFSPDEKKVVATALADNTVVVTDVSTLQKNNSLWTGKQSLFGVAFSPDSKNLLISSDVSGYVSVFSMGGATPITTMDRDELLQMGFRRLINTSLSEPECEKLASLGIPIFDKSFRQKDKSGPQIGCPLPLLAFQKFRLDIQF